MPAPRRTRPSTSPSPLGALLVAAAIVGCSPDKKADDDSTFKPPRPSGAGGSSTSSTGGTGSGEGGSGFVIRGDASTRPPANLSDADTCASSTESGDPIPAYMLFVLDRSGSMRCNFPDITPTPLCEQRPERADNRYPTKWLETKDTLVFALDSLAQRSQNVNVGVSLFPSESGGDCSVGTQPDMAFAPLTRQWVAANLQPFLNGVQPGGRTPLAGASILSYEHLRRQLSNGTIAGNVFVVLFTDGAETCDANQGDDQVERTIAEWAPLALSGFNIRTFVIGAPGSEPARGVLSRLAWAGGTATDPLCDHSGSDIGNCHFDLAGSNDSSAFVTRLTDALEAISKSKALSCEFDVPEGEEGVAVNPNEVNVRYTTGAGDAEDIDRDISADCEAGANGWQYSSDGQKILLCGDACTRVSEDAAAQVEIVLGCPTREIQ